MALRGFSFLGWLSLFSTVQPFDDVVAGYTSRNSDNKRYQIIQGNTPPFLTGIGAVT